MALTTIRSLLLKNYLKRPDYLGCLLLCLALMIQPLMMVSGAAQSVEVMSQMQTQHDHDCCDGEEAKPMKHNQGCVDCDSLFCSMGCMSRCAMNTFADVPLLFSVVEPSVQAHFPLVFSPYQSHIASGLDRPPNA
jgi:hypothetical protein